MDGSEGNQLMSSVLQRFLSCRHLIFGGAAGVAVMCVCVAGGGWGRGVTVVMVAGNKGGE